MWSRSLAFACSFTRPGSGRRQGERRGPRAARVGARDGRQGNELVAQNTDEPFVPASVTKIVTAWLAIEVLGGDYRFKTRFYLDGKRVLYVRGGGDPFLISEELASLAKKLVAVVGRKPIAGIVLDASYYPSNPRIPGIEDTGDAYNALNSALAVNFNTIHAVRSGNKVRSAEKQTPITPLAIEPVPAAGSQRRRSHQPEPGPDGEPAICRRADRGVHRAGRRQSEGQDLHRTRTRGTGAGLRSPAVAPPFGDFLVELLRVSNNYVANQVFLEIGGHRLGGPVSLEKSLQVANEMLAARGLAAAIHLEEGSGISRNNHFTARGLAKVLEHFAPHAYLLRGHDGGLNKTGALEGVRTLAGYADTPGHGRVRFVISLTGNDDGMRFRLLRAIEAGL